MIIAHILLDWYDKEKRDLPWRKTRNPYDILVSEIMLQQTQVSRGLLFYKRWLKEFPNWEVLAKASNAQVIHAWSGLGYNKRALMLRDIAKYVVEHGLPKNEHEWKQLKGIGAYTAAAVSLFSYKHKTFPIDTNIRRVGARIIFGICYPLSDIDQELSEKGREIFDHEQRYDEVIQAIFDFANTYCLKIPQCLTCPLQTKCKAHKTFLLGKVDIPKQMIKKGNEKKHRNKPYPDRIYRGKILQYVKEQKAAIPINSLGKKIDHTFDENLDTVWLKKMVDRMCRDQLICFQDDNISLIE